MKWPPPKGFRSHPEDRTFAEGCLPALLMALIVGAIGIAIVLWLGRGLTG